MTFDNGIKYESPEALGAFMRLESRVFLCVNSIVFQRSEFLVSLTQRWKHWSSL